MEKREERKFDTILLDVDGTLLDFQMAEKVGMEVVLRHYGFEPTPELLALYHGMNEAAWASFEQGELTKESLLRGRFANYFDKLGKKVDGPKAELLYRSQLDQAAFMIAGAREVCAALSARYRLYVVTNGTSSTQYKRLAASGLDRYMKGIFVSEDAGSQKPQKEYFDYCFAHIPDARPERTLLVGDSLSSDMKGAKNAGCAACWFNPEGRPGDPAIPVDYEIRDLRELLALDQRGW